MVKRKNKKRLKYGTIVSDFDGNNYIFLKKKDTKVAYVLVFKGKKIKELSEIEISKLNLYAITPENLEIN